MTLVHVNTLLTFALLVHIFYPLNFPVGTIQYASSVGKVTRTHHLQSSDVGTLLRL